MQTRRSSKLALPLVAILALVGVLTILGCPNDDPESSDDDNTDTVSFTDERVDLNVITRAGALGLRSLILPRGFSGDLTGDDPDQGIIDIITTETEITFAVASGFSARIIDTRNTVDDADDRLATVSIGYGLFTPPGEDPQPRCALTPLGDSTFPADHPLSNTGVAINVFPCFYLVSANNVAFGIPPVVLGTLPVGGAPALATLVLVFDTSRSRVFGDDFINELLTVQLDFVGRLTVNGAETGLIITGSED